jgi:hypothetical protein
MPYIGRPLNAGNLAVQSGTGDGSDTTPIATLDYSVGSSNSIGVYLDGVRQLAGTDFTASGTTLTFTTAPANGVGIDVYFLGLELSIPTPADASVSTAKIIDDAVTGAKIADDAIDSEHYTDGSIDTAHIADDQITLAKMAPGTDGNIITYDASGNPAAVATGSAGQVLTSAGAGAPPTFATASGGDMVLLQSVTASNDATVTVGSSSLITTAYRAYKIFVTNLHNATDNVSGNMRMEIGGAVKTDAKYAYNRQWLHDSGTGWQTGINHKTDTQLYRFWGQSLGNASGEHSNLEITIYDPASTDNYKMIDSKGPNMDLSPDFAYQHCFGAYDNGTAALTGIQFYASSGNIASGYFKLYGIK